MDLSDDAEDDGGSLDAALGQLADYEGGYGGMTGAAGGAASSGVATHGECYVAVSLHGDSD